MYIEDSKLSFLPVFKIPSDNAEYKLYRLFSIYLIVMANII